MGEVVVLSVAFLIGIPLAFVLAVRLGAWLDRMGGK